MIESEVTPHRAKLQIPWGELSVGGCVGDKCMPETADGKMLCIHAPMKIIDAKCRWHFGNIARAYISETQLWPT